MSNIAVPLGAGVIGAFFGPVGFSIGWAIGSAYEMSQTEINTSGQVGDLRVQTAQYGTPIPIVYGKQRPAPGNIFWAQEKKTYSSTEEVGKGGPEVTTTGYTVSLAIGICKGPILGISKVWADGDLIIDSSTDIKPLLGQLYLGDNTQTPDPTMESILGSGNVPAYRGLAYMVLTDFDLGPAGRIPNFSFEVIKEI
jgi:hypothetical protein